MIVFFHPLLLRTILVSNQTAGNIVYDEIICNENEKLKTLSRGEIRVILYDLCYEYFENKYDDTRESCGDVIDVMLILLDMAIPQEDLDKFKSTVTETVKNLLEESS